MEWSTLPHQLDTGTYESKALLNPYTNDIYIIGGYSRDAIDAEIFDQITSNCRLALIGNQNLAVRMPFCTVFEMIVMWHRGTYVGVQLPSTIAIYHTGLGAVCGCIACVYVMRL